MLSSFRHSSGSAGIFVAIIAIGVVTALMLPFRGTINSTTVALLQLFVIVLVATIYERYAALTASLVAALSFNFFFLEPYYTLAIADPQNWIDFFVFLAVALIVGHLSETSNRRRAEAERLYHELQDAFERTSEIEGLKRSENLKTKLLESVTNEFRTPLTSMKASATMLIEDSQLGSTLDRRGRGELLEIINEETDRLNSLVESMVEQVRSEATNGVRQKT